MIGRIYNRRFIKKKIQKQTVSETKDGVIFSVDSTDRYCMVRVQGSTNEIRAFYPETWYKTPYWVKKSVPVVIRQMGGRKDKFEIQGLGQIIPSEVAGSITPTMDRPDDGPTSGCEIIQIPNDPQMGVLVKVGGYRINNTTYTLDAMKCETTYYKMNMGGKISEIAAALEIDPASSTNTEFRYDLIVVGDDEVVDVVKGTTFTTAESIPSVPTSHVELGRILIYPNMSAIYNNDIDRLFLVKDPKFLTIAIDDDDLAWAETETTITVTVKDQYYNDVIKGGYGWYMKLEITDGNGSVGSTEEGSSTSVIGVHCGTSASCKFTYTRDQASTDISPKFKVTLETEFPVVDYTNLILRDSSGDIMTS